MKKARPGHGRGRRRRMRRRDLGSAPADRHRPDSDGRRRRRPVLPTLPADIASRKRLDRRRQVRHAAVRLHRRPGQERGLRRRDREVVRALRVRARATRVTFVCAPTAGARAAADDRPRRPRHLDVHVHGRPRHADRLLAARTTRRPAGCSSRTTRRSSTLADISGKTVATTSGSIYDRWMKRCFTDTRGRSSPTASRTRVLAFNQGRADAVMFDDTVARADRGDRPDVEADRRRVPRGAVRHRHQAGQRRDEAVGRLAAQPDEAEGPLHDDHQEQRRARGSSRRSRRTSCGRTTTSRTGRRRSERRHGVPVA